MYYCENVRIIEHFSMIRRSYFQTLKQHSAWAAFEVFPVEHPFQTAMPTEIYGGRVCWVSRKSGLIRKACNPNSQSTMLQMAANPGLLPTALRNTLCVDKGCNCGSLINSSPLARVPVSIALTYKSWVCLIVLVNHAQGFPYRVQSHPDDGLVPTPFD